MRYLAASLLFLLCACAEAKEQDIARCQVEARTAYPGDTTYYLSPPPGFVDLIALCMSAEGYIPSELCLRGGDQLSNISAQMAVCYESTSWTQRLWNRIARNSN
jgi:hypothetical protein